MREALLRRCAGQCGCRQCVWVKLERGEGPGIKDSAKCFGRGNESDNQHSGTVVIHTSHCPHQSPEATPTLPGLTHPGTCQRGHSKLLPRWPDAGQGQRPGLQCCLLKGFQAGRVLGDHVSQGFPALTAHQLPLGDCENLPVSGLQPRASLH